VKSDAACRPGGAEVEFGIDFRPPLMFRVYLRVATEKRRESTFEWPRAKVFVFRNAHDTGDRKTLGRPLPIQHYAIAGCRPTQPSGFASLRNLTDRSVQLSGVFFARLHCSHPFVRLVLAQALAQLVVQIH
jgi:hypothetical protein